jgi:uncharacterized protein
VKQVPCPRCGRRTLYSPENKWRPFCSERCKMIDLGAWAAEKYRVAGKSDEPAPDKDEG